MDMLTLYLQQFSEVKSSSKPYQATDILADLHLLNFLAVNDIFKFSMVRQRHYSNFLQRKKNEKKRKKEWFLGKFKFFLSVIISTLDYSI